MKSPRTAEFIHQRFTLLSIFYPKVTNTGGNAHAIYPLPFHMQASLVHQVNPPELSKSTIHVPKTQASFRELSLHYLQWPKPSARDLDIVLRTRNASPTSL